MAAMSRTSGRRSLGAGALRWFVLLGLGAYMLLPLVAMLEFSTRGIGGERSFAAWLAIGSHADLLRAIRVSLELALLTVVVMLVLLVPTMVWVQLRLPKLRRLVEFVCLVPLTIPAIVLVVGLAPVYRWVWTLLGESPNTLTFVYVVLVLPFAYRALAAGLGALDLVTLAEAGRSLGCSWLGVVWRIVVPNIMGAIMSAALISVALVLGEFTISSLLNYETLQVVINLLGKRDASVAVAVSLAALLLAATLLFLLSLADQSGRAAARQEEE
jgi:putative spermidine/putrescine transport system permease protein